MKDLFDAIAWFFEEILFIPFNFLRDLELSSWWGANALNFIFILVGLAAFFFWMKQLKSFNDNNEENRDTSAHSFLG